MISLYLNCKISNYNFNPIFNLLKNISNLDNQISFHLYKLSSNLTLMSTMIAII